MATIYLIRHGQASFGSDNYDQLSDLGRRQATLMGEFLRDTGIVLDAAYSGDLSRQRETAQLALASQPGEVSHTIDARFNEIQNDEQIEYLLPEVVKRNPAIQALSTEAGRVPGLSNKTCNTGIPSQPGSTPLTSSSARKCGQTCSTR